MASMFFTQNGSSSKMPAFLYYYPNIFFMYCPKCMNENLDITTTCFYCGQKLPAKGCFIPKFDDEDQ